MATDALDIEQSSRIQNLENRVNEVENQLSAILARLDTLTSIGKALAMLAGTAIGIDVIPMLGA
tara:strand:- start:3456 stop:3647 length:192 start_codon:yes stop_codon:yes gene_type:complete